MKSQFAAQAIQLLKNYCDRQFGGNISAMHRSIGVEADANYLNRWFKLLTTGGKAACMPKLDTIGLFLDGIGARVIMPGETPSPSTITAEVQSQNKLDKDSKEITRLKTELAEARGEIRALERQLERLTPRYDVFPEDDFQKKENAG